MVSGCAPPLKCPNRPVGPVGPIGPTAVTSRVTCLVSLVRYGHVRPQDVDFVHKAVIRLMLSRHR